MCSFVRKPTGGGGGGGGGGSSHLGGQGHSSAHSDSIHWRSGGQDSGSHHPVWARLWRGHGINGRRMKQKLQRDNFNSNKVTFPATSSLQLQCTMHATLLLPAPQPAASVVVPTTLFLGDGVSPLPPPPPPRLRS